MVEALSFPSFCSLMEAVVGTSKPEAKVKLIFSDSFRKSFGHASLYPLLRLLCPHLDRERTYKLKEKKIAMMYVDLLGLSPTSSDGKKLLHWTDPTIVTSRAVGDFAMVLQEVMQFRTVKPRADEAPLTVKDVNAMLDTLSGQDKDAQKTVFLHIVTHCSADEQKWLVRIIIKDMKIGLRHERVLQFIHPDAVCQELTNSMVRYVPQIQPFQVFTPMLAKRVTFGDCTKAMNGNDFYMEPKLDGERITCHLQQSSSSNTTQRHMQLFSRNGVNYSDKYGPCIEAYVQAQVRPDVDCILDGEMLVWDSVDFRYHPFGSLKTVASLPLSARLTLLDRILKSVDHRVVRIEQTLVRSTMTAQERHDVVMADVDAKLAAGFEGLILKDATSHYMCGEVSRRSQKWIKLKPDYAGMTQHLDVLVLGGYYGEGQRRGGAVSHFLLGVLQHPIDPNHVPKDIPVVSFCKVGTGYSLEELDTLRTQLAPHWRPWEPISDKRPAHFRGWAPKGDVRPDVWLPPDQSVCMEVYGFELTYSTQFQTGLTLRFPRLKAIRYDKQWHECLTLSQLNALKGQQLGQKKRAVDVVLGEQKPKKRRNDAERRRSTLDRGHVGVSIEYSQANMDIVEAQSTIFQVGLTFCVLPGKYDAKGVTKATIEQLLFANAATITQNPHPKLHDPQTTVIVAASADGVRVGNYIKQATYNVVYVDWILRCLQTQVRFVQEPCKATDYVFANPETTATLKTLYDRYSDSFTTPVTADDLATILSSAAAFATIDPSMDWQRMLMDQDDETQEAMETSGNFLWRCVVYVDMADDVHMHHVAQCVRLYGGVVEPAIVSTVTHVVLPDGARTAERLDAVRPGIQQLRRSGGREPVVTTSKWVRACVEALEQVAVDAQFHIPC
ncbi:hypothetical protein DYB35_006465 [Aphanomyces astaci]|uniref:DNA ligase IV n=1 Tax=Aphanomyces astaci TaxID=112090 RepID=A0A3R6XJL8_APHAT|nr:hypothetical protein DYB35_006465 [Aphanomyces astaci]